MTNPLSKLEIDTAYKGVTAVSAVVLIAALTVGNAAAAIIALGFLFIGFGEWINHPSRSGVLPASAFQPSMVVTSTARRPSEFGLIMNAAGVVLIGLGVHRLL